MAYVTLDGNGTVTGIFGTAQNPPLPADYAVVPDNDPRIAAFLTPSPIKPTPLDWFLRLSQATQAALDVAARTDTAVSLALRYASGVTFVDVNDPRTVQNVQLLQSKGLITAAEATTLLTP